MPPKHKHPIALAFQDASATASKSSNKISNKIKELNWRQQYSQAEYYPFKYDPDTHDITNDSVSEKKLKVEVTVKQRQCGEQDGTGTGAVVWNAAHCLSSYMCSKGVEKVKGRRVVDLGTGTGLTGIVAVKLGAEEVCFTDVGRVLELTRENIEGNLEGEEGGRVRTEEYWWGSGTLGKGRFGCVLVADCILPKLYPMEPLVEAIDELMVEEGGVCLVSYEHRTWFEFDPRERFLELCEVKGLQAVRVPEQDMVEVAEDIIIWEVTRK